MFRELPFRMIVVLFVVPSVIMICLVVFDLWRAQPQKFERTFEGIRLQKVDSLDLGFNSYTLLIANDSSLLLGNSLAPRVVTHVSVPCLDTTRVVISDAALRGISFKAPQVLADPDCIYIADGSVPVIFQGDYRSFETAQHFDPPRFSSIVAVNSGSFILRAYQASVHQDILAVYRPATGEVREQKSILEKQVDGIFCVDGMMLYNSEHARFIYVYYYRNQFITSDSDLADIKRGRTIDRTEVANFKIDSFEGADTRTTTFSSPPETVNLRSATSGDVLYVVSNVRASNQLKEAFDFNYTIDTYNIHSGEYTGSFLLSPPSSREAIRIFDFRAGSNYLAAIFGDKLHLYKIERFGDDFTTQDRKQPEY